tara:strand:+ start:13491 stop:13985 length:495 start_codon:yes stop_codon:yes gene_type:complete
MKYIIILCLFFSVNIFSQELTKNERISIAFKNKVEKLSDNSVNSDNIKEMLDYIDQKENYTEQQIKALKILSLLNFEAMNFIDNEEELFKIAEKIFQPSLCGAYYFRNDFLRALSEVSQFYISSEDDMNKLKNSFTKMEKLYLNEAHKKFEQSGMDFEEFCSTD